MTAGIDLHPTRPMSFEPLDTEPDQDVGRLLVTCEDRPGICAAICGYLAGHGANITNLQQYTTDPSGGRLFVRVEFLLPGLDEREPDVSAGFMPLADSLGMDWRLARAAAPSGWRSWCPRPTTRCRSCSGGARPATCTPRSRW